MDWSSEPWVKLYTRDTPAWMMLSYRARALFLSLLRKFSRSTGELELGRHGLKALAPILGASWEEIEDPLKELLEDASLEVVSDGPRSLLRCPNFTDAQAARTSDALRKRTERETKNAKSMNLLGGMSQQVTASHTASHGVTQCHDKIRIDKKRKEEKRIEENRKGSCTEPNEKAVRSVPAAVELELIPNDVTPEPETPLGCWLRETYEDVKEPHKLERTWERAYPGIDLLAEGMRAFAWEASNPRNRKTNHSRFLNSWFARAQQNASRGGGAGANGKCYAPASSDAAWEADTFYDRTGADGKIIPGDWSKQ